MKLLSCVLVALVLSGTSCLWPTTPQHHVSGVVRYLDGNRVARAKVWTNRGAATFSDVRGRYSITVPADADSITLFARDGYDGRAYAVNHAGSMRLSVGAGGARGDIVLDHAEIF